jgi:CheY-like chemotaxis protein
MKILLLSKNSLECQLVFKQLRESGHKVDLAKGGLAAISAMGAHSYDFFLAIDSKDDVYDALQVISFAEKHQIPSLLIEGEGREVLSEIPKMIAPQTYATDSQVIATKCASTFASVSELVDTSKEHWQRNWGKPEAAHAT